MCVLERDADVAHRRPGSRRRASSPSSSNPSLLPSECLWYVALVGDGALPASLAGALTFLTGALLDGDLYGGGVSFVPAAGRLAPSVPLDFIA